MNKKSIAYVVSSYPAISHTFITREVLKLREHGHEVFCFSSNKSNTNFERGSDEAKEHNNTLTLKIFSPKYMFILLSSLFKYSFKREILNSIAEILKGNLRYVSYIYQALILSNFVHKNNIEHIHVHFANSTAIVVKIAATLCNKKWSVSIHGHDCFENIDKHYLKSIIKHAHYIRTISKFAKIQILRHADENINDKIQIIRCGVSLPLRTPSKKGNQSMTGLTVGRLVTAKGQCFLIEAIAKCIQEGHKIKWHFIGAGPSERSLKQLVKQLQIESSIEFHGACSQKTVNQYLEKSDIFALTSFAEGIPVSLMEAMSKNVPVISTYTNGIPEMIVNNKNGLLCQPGSVNDIKNALIQLNQNQFLVEKIKKNALQTIKKDYNIDSNGLKMVRFFEQTFQNVNQQEGKILVAA